MTRRLLRVFVGAAFLGALATTAGVTAKPPDLPEDGTITVTPQVTVTGAVPLKSSETEQEDDKPTTGNPVEVLPMPHEDRDVTCPYLRQQMLDHRAVQLADPQIGHDVLDNLARLKKADELLELAKVLANDGYLDEAIACCERAEELCPGSPSAARAADTKLELALGIVRPASDSEEAAEPEVETPASSCSRGASIWRELFQTMGLPLKSEAPKTEPGCEEMVCGLMKACHLLMCQGMHHQAAELARQAFALDPQRVQADPLIRDLVAELKKSKTKTKTTSLLVPVLPKVDYELVPALDRVLTEDAKPTAGAEEASEAKYPSSLEEMAEVIRGGWGMPPVEVETNVDGSLRLSGDCSLGDSVYHLRYTHGCLAIWKTTDAGKTPTK